MATLTAQVDLPPTRRAPGAARPILDEVLAAWAVEPGRRYDAVLLTNELVSNAVEHVGGEVSLQLEIVLSEDSVRVSLADGSSIRPAIRELNHQAPRGRGMQLVAALARRWGSDDHHGGKRVWFELPGGLPT